MTQKELADSLGVTKNTVANWEKGRAIPKLTPAQYKTLLKMLNISVEDLPDYFGPSKPSQNLAGDNNL